MATSYTILVVEQTDVVRRITTHKLAESGCRVLEAANANEALAFLRRPPQVGSPYAHLGGGGAAEGADQRDF